MSTITAARRSGFTTDSDSPTLAQWIREHLGFPLAGIPLIVGLGVVYLMLTLPNLFEILSRLSGSFSPFYVHSALTFLWEQSLRWQTVSQEQSFNVVGMWALRLSLYAIPALWLASLIRAMVVRSWRPFAITAFASLLGAIGIPIACWIGEVVVVGFRVIDVIVTFFVTYILPWILRIGFWLFAAAVAVAVLVGLYRLAVYLTKERQWARLLLGAGIVAVLVVAANLGWLDWLWATLHWLGVWVERIIGWITAFLGPILRWLGKAIVVVLIFVGVVGVAVAFFGEIGRQILLPLRSARDAASNAGRCADLAAGTGIATSLVLTAAVLDPNFREWFYQVWHTSPVLNGIPDPIDGYDFLLPSAAEGIMRPAFVSYQPIVDVAILVLAATIGVLSMLFAPASWIPGEGSRVVRPVLFAVGGTIAIAVLLLALAIVTGAIAGVLRGS